ncbi:phosphoserine phosphatase [Acinetobacter sp. ANC 4558]|uniref:HAD-IB family hydrolase n=1 Tax=Acinetobacter sp. ANC 4558 TaxID=1977876 RepID=UPI000A335326|nr:HAD-IB family hydrolase [Acinetobacter sp. ANC 4558]OTG86338.1 phosphoserine phosphatase [Acinetobacter sp. ANC 4558]
MHEQSKTYKNLALFDFDGTLCRTDSFTKFIFFSLSKMDIIKKGIKVSPWILAYYFRVYPAHYMRPKLFYTLFKSLPQSEIDQIAQCYAKLLLDQYLHPQIYQQLIKHQLLGDHVVLVSASIDIYLKYICEYLNIDLICTKTEIKDQVYTGQFLSKDCSRVQKKQRILECYNLANYQYIFAYGNSIEDNEMLSLADFPYLITDSVPLPLLE